MKKIIQFILLIFFIFILSSCNYLKITTCSPIYVMSTAINIKFYNVDDYEDHYKKIEEIYQNIDKLADDFKKRGSVNNIYDLNELRIIDADPSLIELINYSLELKEKTNGYFNPLVGRLTHLWKDFLNNSNNIINDELIKNEIEIINSSSIEINENKISIIGDANIDLGAIAKGYATKKAVEYLKEENVEGYMINAGESTVALGKKGDNDFSVILEAPYSKKSIKNLYLKDTSISTSSGKYQNKIIDGVRYHHIINPFTGYPSNIYDNINVIIDDPLYADCYSTAMFSMDLDLAKEFSKENDLSVIFYKDDKIIYEKI